VRWVDEDAPVNETLAIEVGPPVCTRPFGSLNELGDEASTAVLRVARQFAAKYGLKHVIDVSSGIAAMHVCVGAISPGWMST